VWHENNNNFYITTKTENISRISLSYLIVAFNSLAFIFQLSKFKYPEKYLFYTEYTDYSIIETQKNPIFFIEHTFTTPLMIILVGLLNGITDICAISLMWVLSAICMIVSGVLEFVAGKHHINILNIISCVCMQSSYFPIWLVFSTANHKDNNTPLSVFIINSVFYLLLNIFNVIQVSQLHFISDKWFGIIGRNSNFSYMLLSMLTKTFLTWMIYCDIIAVQNK
jgi:hypothetical protein